MKILIYTQEFPPFKGGAGVYSHDLAVGLASLGVEVHVLAPPPAAAARASGDVATIDGLHLHYLAASRSNVSAALRLLCDLQLRHRFDLMLVTERRAQEHVARMPRGLLPYAAVLHGSEVLSYFGGRPAELAVPRRLMARFLRRARFCLAVSEATARLAQRLLPAGHARLVAVPNGIDTGRLPPPHPDDVQELRSRLPEDVQIVFCLGRLDLDKGQDILIRAFEAVRRTCPRARLLLGGEGPSRAALMRLRSDLRLDDCVEFLGEIPAAKLAAYFAVCDVFVLPSRCEDRWEGFGLVYLEAGYYGKPVIGGNEGGVPEAIAHGESGLVVDPRDSHAVADAIGSLLADTNLAARLGTKGRERVIAHFNARRMAGDTLRHIVASGGDSGPAPAPTGKRLSIWRAMYGLGSVVSELFLRLTGTGRR